MSYNAAWSAVQPGGTERGGEEGLWKAVMMKYAPQARDFRISMMNEAMEKGTVRAENWPSH